MSWEIVSKQVNIFTYIGVRKVAVGFCCEQHCAQQSERKTHLATHDPDLAMKSQIRVKRCVDR